MEYFNPSEDMSAIIPWITMWDPESLFAQACVNG